MSIEFDMSNVVICTCEKPMIPNLSTGDEDGYGWTCTTLWCGEWAGGEIEAEDLIACGCPEWLARRIEALSDAILTLENR